MSSISSALPQGLLEQSWGLALNNWYVHVKTSLDSCPQLGTALVHAVLNKSQFQWPKLCKHNYSTNPYFLTSFPWPSSQPHFSKFLFWPPDLFRGHSTSPDSSFLHIYLFNIKPNNAKELKPSPMEWVYGAIWQKATVSVLLLIIPACEPVEAE